MIESTRQLGKQLERSGRAILALVHDLEAGEAKWKPSPEKWSILEVVNHLADEEVEDFRTRLDIMLHRPDEPFPAIDPQGWVTSRGYADRDLKQSIDRFRAERKRSMEWLASLKDANPHREKPHPSGRVFTGRQMMAAWAAHDLLHVRQITRLRYEFLAFEAAPVSLEYAGTW